MVTLIILDGFGLNRKKFGNAIASAGTPYLDKLIARYPHSSLKASGKAVGLPDGQMGNSEVGHLTLGAGRVIWQDLLRIDNEIENGEFFKNPRLNKAIDHALQNNSALHILGLLSDGGVHSHIRHLFAIIDLAKSKGLQKVFIHPFLDGRDTYQKSAIKYLDMLQDKIATTSYKIASLSGRIYAMDREERYERLQKAYDVLAFGKNFTVKSYQEAIEDSYKDGVYDEFFEPVLLVKDGFIDRYSGQKLVNPGLLKVLSYYMPDVFPYHSHWKMENCHNAYWELVPTLDHIFPIALGGSDDKENWTTTSMLHNSIKSNWTLKQLNWKLYESGDFKVYDGLTSLFVQLVEADEALLNDSYIYRWYHLSIKFFDDEENQL